MVLNRGRGAGGGQCRGGVGGAKFKCNVSLREEKGLLPRCDQRGGRGAS